MMFICIENGKLGDGLFSLLLVALRAVEISGDDAMTLSTNESEF